jgi:Ca2+-transporting ATPase
MTIANSIIEKSVKNDNHIPESGLTQSEVVKLRQQYGENRLPAEKGTTIWTILLNQIKSPLVYIILVAAGVSFVVREYNDFAIIMAVVIIDVILGFIQEYQAQQTYTALKGLLKPTTTVIRDGQRQEIEVWELVPGDVILLNSGEHVPADGIITDSTKLSIDEAILTGESEPVNKTWPIWVRPRLQDARPW